MVIGEMARQFDFGSELSQTFFETFGRRNPAQRSDIKPLEIIQRQTLLLKNMLQVQRLMCALDNFRRPIMLPDAMDKFAVGFAVALCNENVASPPQIARRFAQCSAS